MKLISLNLQQPAEKKAAEGVFTPLEETIASFKAVTEGQYDNLPEQAFYMVGGIEDAEKKAREMER